MIMKKLAVLTSPRTGSTWMMNRFSMYKDIINVGEMFSFYLKDNNTRLSALNNSSYKLCKENINEYKNLTDIELSDKIKEDGYKHLKIIEMGVPFDYKIMAFKFFNNHVTDYKYKEMILSEVDYIIINYRKNILKQWISYKKAIESNIWQNENLDEVKIFWDENDFLNFRNRILNDYIEYKKYMWNVPNCCVSYEELHEVGLSEDEKAKILNDKLISMRLDEYLKNTKSNFKSCFKKQSHIESFENNFKNPKDFLKFDNIKLFNIEF